MTAVRPKPTIIAGDPLDVTTVKFETADLHNCIVARDTDGIIKVICKYATKQRMQLVESYRDEYRHDPIEDLKKDFHGDFEDLITGLLLWPSEYACKQIQKAIGRTGMNIRVIIDILATSTNAEINEIKRYYKQNYNRDLMEHLHAESTGTIRQIFSQFLNNCRKEQNIVNVELGNQQAVELMAVVEVTPERLENFLTCLITKEPIQQLNIIFHEFENLNSDVSLEKVIEAKLSGDAKTAIKSIVEITRSATRYYAQRLQKSLDAWVIDAATISRIIISRREIDLDDIKLEYKILTNHDLARDIRAATSGDLRRCLLALLGKK